MKTKLKKNDIESVSLKRRETELEKIHNIFIERYCEVEKIKAEYSKILEKEERKEKAFELETIQAQWLLKNGENTEHLNDETIAEAIEVLKIMVDELIEENKENNNLPCSIIQDITEKIETIFSNIKQFNNSDFNEDFELENDVWLSNFDVIRLMEINSIVGKLKAFAELLEELIYLNTTIIKDSKGSIDTIVTYSIQIQIEISQILSLYNLLICKLP